MLAGFPVVLLLAQASAWVRTAVDLPASDDWRAYIWQLVLNTELPWLTAPQNGTIYPVGKILDVLAHVTLGGNTIVYQLLTMVGVLGGLLIMQWLLLRWAFRDALHAAIAFSLCGLMLMLGAYWGGPNIGYHQALPLVAVMAALVIALRPVPASWWVVLAGLALGLLAGLTYISGAFSVFAAGAVMVAAGAIGRFDARRRVLWVGAGLLLAGIVTGGLQILYTRVWIEPWQAGPPVVMPWEPDFWFFMAGKIGRSLGVEPLRWKLAVTLTAGAIVAIFLAIAWSLRTWRKKPAAPPRAHIVAVVLPTLAATIFVYLLIISAARSQAWPFEEPPTALDIFQSGFHRFHFFWVTLLWPWVGAVALALILGWRRNRPRPVRAAALALGIMAPLLILSVSWNAGAYDYEVWFKARNASRMETYRCLLRHIQGDDSQACYEVGDIGGLVAYARSIDASWVRTLETVPITINEPVFALHDPSTGTYVVHNAEVVEADGVLRLRAEDDPQIVMEASDAETLAKCRTLEFTATLSPERADLAQAFYQRPGDERFSRHRLSTVGVGAGDAGQVTATHILFSEEGFGPTLRYDPVLTAQDLEVADLEVRCRLSAD